MMHAGATPVVAQQAISPALMQTVSRVGEWITTTTPNELPAIKPGGLVLSLDRATQFNLSTMAARLSGARLLAAEVYEGKPATLAGDLSRQLRACQDVGQENLKPLFLSDSNEKRLNDIACDFACELLDFKPGDSVAAMVYWFADEKTHSLMRGAEPEPKLILVLMKLRKTGENYELDRIAWGVAGATGTSEKR